MAPHDRKRAKELFEAVLERGPDARRAFLEEACSDDPELRRAVESMLDAEGAAGFTERLPPSPEATVGAPDEGAVPKALRPGSRLGPYEVLGFLAAGGMGEVYRARDVRLGRDVALKVLPARIAEDPESCSRFEQEARAASALNHPNIVTIHEISEAEGHSFIVMELVSGRTLAELDLPLPMGPLVRVGEQVARALAAAHAAGIVHRDIKPKNIVVRDDGYVKVLDFGIARLFRTDPVGSGAADPTVTEAGHVLGTARYMSPEHARGADVDGATDLFSLGIVLYELATGQHPFAAASSLEVLQAIASQPPIPPSRFNPEIPSSLDGLILRLLEKDPRLRPDAAEVAAALGELGGAGGRLIPRREARHTVGRDRERGQLRAGLETTVAGHGVLVCVAGEPGIGKTTLVEDFLGEVASGGPPCLIARGRCSERLAGVEAYLPILEALESLLRVEGGDSAVRVMRLLAPAWYAQVVSTEPVISHAAGAAYESQERLKRELVAFLEEASRLRPVVLFLDDVHWADASTVDLLAYVATKFDSLRVMVVATYRSTELMLARHPFLQVKLDLQARGSCHEIALEFLGRDDVEAYLGLEFPGSAFPEGFARLVYGKTEGSPLFMVDLVRYLRDKGVVAEERGRWILAQSLHDIELGLPESTRSMIQRKIDQLKDEDRRVLVAASVQGFEFDTAVLARALRLDPVEVEERMDGLDRVHALVRRVREEDLPDRTPTLRYRFVHVLYQNALYASLTPSRRVSLGAAVAATLLDAFRERSPAVASELAFLFEVARDFGRASENFLTAARNASQIFAYREATLLAQRGLVALQGAPEGPDRLRRELALELTLGGLMIVVRGGGDSEVGKHFRHARELSERVGEGPELFTALRGLSEFYHESARLETARDMAERALRVAERLGDPTLLVDAHHALAIPLTYLGQLGAARDHLMAALPLYVRDSDRTYGALYQAIEPGVGCRFQAGRCLWLLGHPDQALAHIEEGIALAHRLGHHYSLGQINLAAAFVHQFRREAILTREHAEAAMALAEEQGSEQVLAQGAVWHGWSLAAEGRMREAIPQMREHLSSPGGCANVAMRPHLLALFAEALGWEGSEDEALAVVEEALSATETGGRYYKAELLRLKGELLLAQAASRGAGALAAAAAETSFEESLDLARRQGARSLELRSAMSLARLWRSQSRLEIARTTLAEVYGSFAEGFETGDLREAASLLKGLG